MPRLGNVGRKLAEALGEYFNDQDLELTPHERALVLEICTTVDRLDLCARMVAIHPVEIDEEGRKVKDWMTEERNQKLVLARLIKSANLSTEIVDQFAHGAKPWSARRSDNKARQQKENG